MSLPVAILAGGLATRLRPVTARIPKSLIEMAGRPFAEHQIERLRDRGLTDLVFCAGHLGDMLAEALGDGGRWGVRIRYSFDGPGLLGTGGSLRQALPSLGDAFFVLYGDSYLDCDYQAVEQAFRGSGKLGLMTVFRNEGRWERCNVLFDNGRIARYDKARPTPDMRHIDYGLSALGAEALAAHPDGSSFDLGEVYRDLLSRDELAAVEVTQRFYEIGSPAGLEETRRYLEQKHELRQKASR